MILKGFRKSLKIILIFLMLFYMFFYNTYNVYSQIYENEVTSGLDNEISNYLSDLKNIDITLEDGTTVLDTIKSIFSGEIIFSLENLYFEMKNQLIHLLTYEFQAQKTLMIQLLLMVILSSMLKQISESLSGKSVGDMGFFICYMILVVLIIDSFYSISEMVLNRVDQISVAFITMIPVFVTVSAVSGGVTQSALLGSSVMAGCTAITYIMKEFLLPITLLTMSMEMADNISDKPMLSRLVNLLKKGLSWFLKILSIGFMLLTSLQKISGDAINNMAMKTAKIAVQAVPIVGDVMGGAVDTMAVFTTSLKNGTLVGVIVFLILLGLPILIKLCVIYFVFKIISAVGEFICEERLIDCISSAGDYIGIMIGVIFLIQGMFIFSTIILLGDF